MLGIACTPLPAIGTSVHVPLRDIRSTADTLDSSEVIPHAKESAEEAQDNKRQADRKGALIKGMSRRLWELVG
jgi:hypothetical protein